MATRRTSVIATPEELDRYLTPRGDILIENLVSSEANQAAGHPHGSATFVQQSGPFRSYERNARWSSKTSDAVRVIDYSETTSFRMAIPFWGPAVDFFLMGRAVKDLNREPRHRWWWPDEIVTTHTTSIIALLSFLGMIGAYIGVLIGQTVTFAATEFGSSVPDQTRALAFTRSGVILTTLVIWRADRIGRKPLLIGFAAGASIFTIAGAFSPNLATLTVTQAIGRGCATGLLTLVTLAATEEIPRTMRAFILSILTLCGALGAGAVLWFLPLADISPQGWRMVYLVPVLFLPAIVRIHRSMPETRRFTAADQADSPGLGSVNLRWFAVVVFIYTAVSIFGAPASQLQNEYLRENLDFAAREISLFRTVITTPAGLVILLAGWVADRRGRRAIAAVSLAVGSIMSAVFFTQEGTGLWITAGVSAWLGGAAFPVIRAYQTELFPTRSRAMVGGWLDLLSVGGSALGLIVAGQLIDGGRSINEALLFLLPLPLFVALSIPLLLPKTAGVELEDLNPNDPDLMTEVDLTPGAST